MMPEGIVETFLIEVDIELIYTRWVVLYLEFIHDQKAAEYKLNNDVNCLTNKSNKNSHLNLTLWFVGFIIQVDLFNINTKMFKKDISEHGEYSTFHLLKEH